MAMKGILQMFFKAPTMRGSYGQRICSGLSIFNQYQNDPTRVAYKYIVQPEDVNILGTLHGGAICSMVDITTTISIIKLSKLRNFFNPAKAFEELRIQNWIKKHGKKIAFTECEIYNKQDKLIAKGSHIKAFIDDDWGKKDK